MKKSNLAGAPKPKAPPITATDGQGNTVAVTTIPVSGLTRRALLMARQKHAEESEAIGQEASKLEGYAEADGWRLDLNLLVWFRPKQRPTTKPELVKDKKTAEAKK